MGIFDDAIREHLDLKRRRGALYSLLEVAPFLSGVSYRQRHSSETVLLFDGSFHEALGSEQTGSAESRQPDSGTLIGLGRVRQTLLGVAASLGVLVACTRACF